MQNLKAKGTQAGFSVIEMLIAAFILAVGILGLIMLQVMSLKASRGSKSLSSAILVAEQVMDRVEMEGRLSWLNITDTNSNVPSTATDLTHLRYITDATLTAEGVTELFNSKGEVPDATSSDPVVSTAFFTVTTTRVLAPAAATGRLSDVKVRVKFVDDVDRTNVAIQRELSLTRRIIHG